MHWLVRDITEAEDSQAIVSFDLAAEKFREASTLESSEGTEFLGIGILDGWFTRVYCLLELEWLFRGMGNEGVRHEVIMG